MWSNLCAFIVFLFTLIDSIIWLKMERFNSCGVSARQLLHPIKSTLLDDLGVEFCCFELVTKCQSIFYFKPFIPNWNQDLTNAKSNPKYFQVSLFSFNYMFTLIAAANNQLPNSFVHSHQKLMYLQENVSNKFFMSLFNTYKIIMKA